MRNYLFSISSVLLLFLSFNHTPAETYEAKHSPSFEMEDLTFAMEEDVLDCNLTFSYSQDYSCCNTDNDGCACLNLTISGLYEYGCAYNVTDIWFESMFLCSQGQWNGTSPTVQIDLDLYAAYSGSSTVYLPVTMRWTYNCGWGTCTGGYSKSVKMLIC